MHLQHELLTFAANLCSIKLYVLTIKSIYVPYKSKVQLTKSTSQCKTVTHLTLSIFNMKNKLGAHNKSAIL